MYVFAVTAAIKPHLGSMPTVAASPRLYAYPTEPDAPAPGSFVILDSGAYGLSKRGRVIDDWYMRDLARYYREWRERWPGQVHCIAPDVYLDPKRTVENWKVWRRDERVPVVPVIQFERARRLDVCVADWQARFYAHAAPALVAISNPGMRAAEATMMAEIVRLTCHVTGATWMHNLGAGWDPLDAAAWLAIGFESIDSIAYAEDAKRHRRWRVAGREMIRDDGITWRTAEANAWAVAATVGMV